MMKKIHLSIALVAESLWFLHPGSGSRPGDSGRRGRKEPPFTAGHVQKEKAGDRIS